MISNSFDSTQHFFKDSETKKLAKLAIVYSALLVSWLVSPTHAYWNKLDTFVFQTLNSTLTWHPYWAIFWAYMNADILDRVMEVLVFGLTFLGIYRLPGSFKQNFWSFFKYYLAFTLTFILVKWLLHKGLHIKRLSPTMIDSDAIRLKGLISFKLKDASRNSFPADHALFLFLMYQYARKTFDSKVKSLLLTIVLLFTFPRLISGGHWATDAFFGAWMPSAIFSASWFAKTNKSDKSV